MAVPLILAISLVSGEARTILHFSWVRSSHIKAREILARVIPTCGSELNAYIFAPCLSSKSAVRPLEP